MTCEEVLDFLGEHLDGTLSWRQRIVFKLHLAVCRNCRRYLFSYRETVGIAHQLNHQLSRDMESAPPVLLRAILAARGSHVGSPGVGDQSPGDTAS